jgi:hypothetical protein
MTNVLGHSIFVAGTVSQQTTLPPRSEDSRLRGGGDQDQVTVFNLGANTAHVTLSTEPAATASAADTEVPAGGSATLPFNNELYIAAIAAEGPAVLCVAVGN